MSLRFQNRWINFQDSSIIVGAAVPPLYLHSQAMN
jgi:hypothetical protein